MTCRQIVIKCCKGEFNQPWRRAILEIYRRWIKLRRTIEKKYDKLPRLWWQWLRRYAIRTKFAKSFSRNSNEYLSTRQFICIWTAVSDLSGSRELWKLRDWKITLHPLRRRFKSQLASDWRANNPPSAVDKRSGRKKSIFYATQTQIFRVDPFWRCWVVYASPWPNDGRLSTECSSSFCRDHRMCCKSGSPIETWLWVVTSQETRKFNVDSDDFPSPILGKDTERPGNLYKTILFDKRVRKSSPISDSQQAAPGRRQQKTSISQTCVIFFVPSQPTNTSRRSTLQCHSRSCFNLIPAANAIVFDSTSLASSRVNILFIPSPSTAPTKLSSQQTAFSYLQFSYERMDHLCTLEWIVRNNRATKPVFCFANSLLVILEPFLLNTVIVECLLFRSLASRFSSFELVSFTGLRLGEIFQHLIPSGNRD